MSNCTAGPQTRHQHNNGYQTSLFTGHQASLALENKAQRLGIRERLCHLRRRSTCRGLACVCVCGAHRYENFIKRTRARKRQARKRSSGGSVCRNMSATCKDSTKTLVKLLSEICFLYSIRVKLNNPAVLRSSSRRSCTKQEAIAFAFRNVQAVY